MHQSFADISSKLVLFCLLHYPSSYTCKSSPTAPPHTHAHTPYTHTPPSTLPPPPHTHTHAHTPYTHTITHSSQSLDPELDAILGNIKDNAPKYNMWDKTKVSTLALKLMVIYLCTNVIRAFSASCVVCI